VQTATGGEPRRSNSTRKLSTLRSAVRQTSGVSPGTCEGRYLRGLLLPGVGGGRLLSRGSSSRTASARDRAVLQLHRSAATAGQRSAIESARHGDSPLRSRWRCDNGPRGSLVQRFSDLDRRRAGRISQGAGSQRSRHSRSEANCEVPSRAIGRGEVCPGAEARASQLRDRKFLRCERVSLYQSSRQTAVWPLTNPSRRTGASSQRRRSCLAIAQLPVRRTRRTIEKRKRPIPPGRPVGGQRDQITDATQTWPDTRPVVELGTIEVRRIVENSDALQRTMVFDPMRLIDGVEPSDDPILQARPAAYSVSYRRRTASS
jgi:hypothetical protein